MTRRIQTSCLAVTVTPRHSNGSWKVQARSHPVHAIRVGADWRQQAVVTHRLETEHATTPLARASPPFRIRTGSRARPEFPRARVLEDKRLPAQLHQGWAGRNPEAGTRKWILRRCDRRCR